MKAKRLLNLVGDRLHTLPLVVLYLTDGCNSRCVTCDIWRSPRRNMRREIIEQVVDACAELQIRWVLLSGGEAMQHPHWPQIGRRLRENGARVMLLTNGLLLRKQADDLVGSVDEVIVSLDGGTAATYEAIRGVDAFDLVLDGIRAAKQYGLPVTTRTTVQRMNFREMPQILDVAVEAGVDRVSFLAVDVSSEYAFGPRFGGDDLTVLPIQTAALNPTEVDELSSMIDTLEARLNNGGTTEHLAESPAKLRRILVEYFRALNGEGVFPRPRCNAPHFSTVIEVDGTLRPCYFLPSYGRLDEAQGLKSALNLGTAQALRLAYRVGERAECERCVCPLYKGPRALLEM
ncbi:MAG: radical SAM protein [bacterium]|nr:radical SAM protein [bacterium]